jgi:hypothetical protein
MNKLVIILIATLVLVGLVVGGYFLFKKQDGDSILEELLKELEEVKPEDIVEIPKKKQVFNVSNNVFNYDEARSVCEAYGGDLASLDQVVEAYKEGGDWCNYGWSEGQLALYPTQEETFKELEENPETQGQCGLPGVNGGYFENENLKLGANCYGPKPEPSLSQQQRLEQEQYLLNPLSRDAQRYKARLDDLDVSPFSKKKWSKYQEDNQEDNQEKN